MAYIKVNHAVLVAGSKQLLDYVTKQKESMLRMEESMEVLGSSWGGEDSAQVQRSWSELNGEESVSSAMANAIRRYANSIGESAMKYKEAQARAINRANLLCK